MNAAAIKKELFRLLKDSPDLAGVQVTYAFPGNIDMECVYGGDAQGPITLHAFRAGGRQPRLQDATIAVHIRVDGPGGEVADTEVRAEEIATLVTDFLAANPTLGDFQGLKHITASEFELKSAIDDDGAITLLTLQVNCRSILT